MEYNQVNEYTSIHLLERSKNLWVCMCSRFPAQPEWLQVMSDSEVEISSELQWSCAAAGKPRPTIRWLRNGLPLTTQVSYMRTHTTGAGFSSDNVCVIRNEQDL